MADKLYTTRDQGPFTGMHPALDHGDIPRGGSVQQVNMANEPGNPAVIVTRKGLALRAHADRLPAEPWVTNTAYVAGDIVWASYQTWRCIVNHTSSASFVLDVALAAPKWRPVPTAGIVVEGGLGDSTQSIFVQVINSNIDRFHGETVLFSSFKPEALLSQPPRFQTAEVPPDTPPQETLATDPEYAYLMAFSMTTDDAVRLVKVDIAPLSATAANARITALATTGAGYAGTDSTNARNHNPWVVKGLDNLCYWLAWRRRKNGSTTPAARLTHFGVWDGTDGGGLTDITWHPNDGTRNVEADPSDVPTVMTLLSDMRLILIGDDDKDARYYTAADPETPVRPPGDRPLSNSRSDLIWRFQADALPSALYASDAICQRAIKNQRQMDAGHPELHGLPNGEMLYTITTSDAPADDVTEGIHVKRLAWDGDLLSVSAERVFTTGDRVPDDPTGMNEWNRGPKVAAISRTRFVVTRWNQSGAEATLWNLETGERTNFNPTQDYVMGAVVHHRLGIVFLVTTADPGAEGFKVEKHDINGNYLQVAYSSTEYPRLADDYRGMCLDANGKRLAVFSYDSSGTANYCTLIEVDTPDWVTATAYTRGDLVVTGATRVLYVCLVHHTSGTFATDLAALKWQAVTTTYTLNTTNVPAANRPWMYGFEDSAGYVLRNFVSAQVP